MRLIKVNEMEDTKESNVATSKVASKLNIHLIVSTPHPVPCKTGIVTNHCYWLGGGRSNTSMVIII